MQHGCGVKALENSFYFRLAADEGMDPYSSFNINLNTLISSFCFIASFLADHR